MKTRFGDIPEELILNAACYMVNEHEYDYDSGSMDNFLDNALGIDPHDPEFLDWYFENITKALGYEEELIQSFNEFFLP